MLVLLAMTGEIRPKSAERIGVSRTFCKFVVRDAPPRNRSWIAVGDQSYVAIDGGGAH
jgi:hypothetical protein